MARGKPSKPAAKPAAAPAATGKNRKSNKSGQKRALNAFAIASAESNAKADSRRAGPPPKRSKEDEDDAVDEGSVDGGEDSDGNEWRMGELATDDDDSDIDSDDAMGESDEERFEDFAFRGTTGIGKKKTKKAGKLDLNENDDEEEDSDEDTDMDGEGFIDLSEMLDRATPVSDSEDEEADTRKKSKRRAPASDDDVDNLDFGQGSSEGEDSEDGSDEDSDAESEDSFAKFDSEDEGMSEDEMKLDALADTIAGLPTSDRPNKRARLADHNEPKAPGDYNLSLGSSSQKLTLSDLLPTISDPALKKNLKLAEGEKASTKLAAPLAKRQQDRIDRSAAYDATKEQIGRWTDTVKHNREAEHLSFPLANAPNAPLAHPKKLAPMSSSDTKPMNAFEAAISGILKESNMESEKQIAEFETLATQKLSLEDVQRKNAALKLQRELMWREEAKAKRLKKIKSKTYHRIKKKERLREEEAIRAAEEEMRGGEVDSEEEMERERRRAVERMSLKHKSSKWAKGMKESGRTAWDEDARHGAQEMARRSDELRRRIEGKDIGAGSDSDPYDESSDDDDFDESGAGRKQKILDELGRLESETSSGAGKNKIMAMKFMQNAEAAKRKENEALIASLKDAWEDKDSNASDSDNDEPKINGGRMSFRPQKAEEPVTKTKKDRSEFEAPAAESDDESDDDNIKITNTASSASASKNPFTAPGAAKKNHKQQQKQPLYTDDVEEESNPWLTATSSAKPKAKAVAAGKIDAKGQKIAHKLSKDKKSALNAAAEAADPSVVTIDTSLTLKVARQRDSDDEAGSDDEQISLIPSQGKKSESQRELVKMAFAGDNVVTEFRREKRKIEAEEGDQVVDETLPGWGSWGGVGLTKKQKQAAKRRQVIKTVKGVSIGDRKDKGLERVVVNEKRDRKVCFAVLHDLAMLGTNDIYRHPNSKQPTYHTASRRRHSTRGACGYQLDPNGLRRRLSRALLCQELWLRLVVSLRLLLHLSSKLLPS